MELPEFQPSCQSSKYSHADVMMNSSKYENVERYFKKFAEFSSCTVLEKLSVCAFYPLEIADAAVFILQLFHGPAREHGDA